MKCPECVAAGEQSLVYPGLSMCTLLYCTPFYDEDGQYHHHDSNTTTTTYSCSRGHTWAEDSTPRCWCGWPEKS